MAAWSEGYFTEVQYTGHFYSYMAPAFVRAACILQGVRPAEMEDGSAYLELGCGQGFGLNLLAAANPGIRFHGIDFHPGQIANAERLARAAGLGNVSFEDLSFAQLLALPDERMPRVDLVALHGVYSWISPENRAAIVQIIDRVLKPGGLVFVSYNALPGWQPHVAVQRFLAEHYAQGAGEPETRLAAALQALRQMVEAETGFLQQSPAAKQIVERISRQSPAYLFHEYLNADHHALFHAEVAREMEGARLTFAASAVGVEDIAALAAPAGLRPMIEAAHDITWKQTLLDYAGDKVFRRDIFVRGRNELQPAERLAQLRAIRFALLVPAAGMKLQFGLPIGALTGDPKLYGPIVAALADGPKTIAELAALPELGRTREDPVIRAVTVLMGAGRIHPVTGGDEAAASAIRFNMALLRDPSLAPGGAHLAAGRIGTGVHLSPAELAALRTLVAGAEAEPGLGERIETVRTTKLPLLKALGAL